VPNIALLEKLREKYSGQIDKMAETLVGGHMGKDLEENFLRALNIFDALDHLIEREADAREADAPGARLRKSQTEGAVADMLRDAKGG
jgi:hypothetical protein